MTQVAAESPPETVASPNPRKNHRPVAKINPLESEVVAFFVQICRLLGQPCKIYNILQVCSPVLYIGPVPSHISEIACAANGEFSYFAARHGEVERVVEHILRARAETIPFTRHISPHLQSLFPKEAVLPKLIAELESA